MADPCGSAGEGMAAALTASGSLKGEIRALRRRPSIKPSLEADELINLLHGSDPVKVELNRLENEVRGWNAALICSVFCCFLSFFWLLKCFGIFRQRSGVGRGACGD